MARVYQFNDYQPNQKLHREAAEGYAPPRTLEGETSLTMRALRRLIENWGGLAVAVIHHQPTGSWIFIAFHDVTLGPAVGGCRINTYDTPIEGLQDAMRLAEGMTHKWATLGAKCGGGKAVIALPGPLSASERKDVITFFGHILESLLGAFWTAGDLGTTPSDLETLKLATRYLHCFHLATGRPIDSGFYTALGVAASIHHAVKHVFAHDKLADLTILVQGVGQVGSQLARILNRSGATVLISDLNAERSRKFHAETGCEIVPPEAVLETRCDVYAPCASGGILTEHTVARLQCRIVAGAANNQLQEPKVADLLHQRGILYAPDYVVNAGGAIALQLFARGSNEGQVIARVTAIGDTLGEILKAVAGSNESPLHHARRQAESVLSRSGFPDGMELAHLANCLANRSWVAI